MIFERGDRVHYDNGTFSGYGKIIKRVYNESSIYYIKTHSGNRYCWESGIKLIELTDDEIKLKEVERFKHIEIDPFGEEIWS